MSLDLYASFGCTELWNRARLRCYVDSGIAPNGIEILCEGCDGMAGLVPAACSCGAAPTAPGEDGYQLPELDAAAWYDANAPESADFAGLLVTEVEMSSPYGRTVTPNIGSGQTLGRLRLQGRTITVRGWLIGRTCCATTYGLRWLTQAIAGGACSGDGADCSGDDLTFLDCCPSKDTGSHMADSCEPITICPETGEEEMTYSRTGRSEYQNGLDYLRTFHDVGIVSGPEVLSRQGIGCGCGCNELVEVEMVFATGSPWMFGQERTCAMGLVPRTCNNDDCYDEIYDTNIGEECPNCDDLTRRPDCLDDPDCPPLPMPPSAPVVIPDCFCEVLEYSKVACNLSPDQTKDWFDAAANIVINNRSSKALRGVTVQIFPNPLNLDDPNDPRFHECYACSTLGITYIPPNSTFRFDSERRSVTTTCGNVSRSAARNVVDLSGRPFNWVELNSCDPYMIIVGFDCDNERVLNDVTVDITYTERFL